MDEAVFNHVADLFRRKHGSNVWFELDAEDLLPSGIHSPMDSHLMVSSVRKWISWMFGLVAGSCHHWMYSLERGYPLPCRFIL